MFDDVILDVVCFFFRAANDTILKREFQGGPTNSSGHHSCWRLFFPLPIGHYLRSCARDPASQLYNSISSLGILWNSICWWFYLRKYFKRGHLICGAAEEQANSSLTLSLTHLTDQYIISIVMSVTWDVHGP